MKSKIIILVLTFLLFLPVITADISVKLGEPYTNIKDSTRIKFSAHSGSYGICAGDSTTIPIIVKNQNSFPDTFVFNVDKDYAELSSKRTVLRSGGSGILLLTLEPSVDMEEEETTVVLSITTREEGLKRSLMIRTDINECYLSSIELEIEKDDVCGCQNKSYELMLKNEGTVDEEFEIDLDGPSWADIIGVNRTIILGAGEEKAVMLDVNVPCGEDEAYTLDIEATSTITERVSKMELELDVTPETKCYDTKINAKDLKIDYSGANLPIVIENKGTKDLNYDVKVEGISWSSLSQNSFDLNSGQKKTLNLNLLPPKQIVEGDYSVDIKVTANGEEFIESINVKLKDQHPVVKKIKFYLNYYKYYIWLGVMLLVIFAVLFLVLGKKKGKKEVKKLVAKTEKREANKIKKEVKPVFNKKLLVNLIFWIFGFILAGFLFFSLLKYKEYYSKSLNFMSDLFMNYLVPYGRYFRYGVVAIGILVVVWLIVDYFKKRPKKDKVKPKNVLKKSEKKVKKNKSRFFEYFYIILVAIIFLTVISLAVLKFLSKELFGKIMGFGGIVLGYLRAYYLYIVIGVVALLALMLILYLIKRQKKSFKKKSSKKVEEIVRKIAFKKQ